MSVDKIKSLLELMKQHDLVELKLDEGELHIKLRKAGAFPAPVVGLPAQAAAAPLAMPMAAPGPSGANPAITSIFPVPLAGAEMAARRDDGDAGLVPVKSPIVGTFYAAPGPETAAFVEVGSKVTKASVVCIIEAMKIMNEIKAGVDGTIARLLVENGEPVEYDQPLFMVRP
jgi:acetyl-CoA carboxylase biotin carboxyl carrier protein